MDIAIVITWVSHVSLIAVLGHVIIVEVIKSYSAVVLEWRHQRKRLGN